MDPPLYLRFHTPEGLLRPIDIFGIHPHYRKETLCEEVLPGIANPNRYHTGILVHHYQEELLQGPI